MVPLTALRWYRFSAIGIIVYNNEKSTRILQVANMVRNKERNAVERWVIYKKQRKKWQ